MFLFLLHVFKYNCVSINIAEFLRLLSVFVLMLSPGNMCSSHSSGVNRRVSSGNFALLRPSV